MNITKAIPLYEPMSNTNCNIAYAVYDKSLTVEDFLNSNPIYENGALFNGAVNDSLDWKDYLSIYSGHIAIESGLRVASYYEIGFTHIQRSAALVVRYNVTRPIPSSPQCKYVCVAVKY